MPVLSTKAPVLEAWPALRVGVPSVPRVCTASAYEAAAAAGMTGYFPRQRKVPSVSAPRAEIGAATLHNSSTITSHILHKGQSQGKMAYDMPKHPSKCIMCPGCQDSHFSFFKTPCTCLDTYMCRCGYLLARAAAD